MFSRPKFHEIDPASLAALAPARIVDVREPHEHAGELGHLPDADLVPLATLPSAAAGWDRDETIVVVCRSGGRSARGCEVLAGLGFRRAVNLRGGMLAVAAAGLPVSRSRA